MSNVTTGAGDLYWMMRAYSRPDPGWLVVAWDPNTSPYMNQSLVVAHGLSEAHARAVAERHMHAQPDVRVALGAPTDNHVFHQVLGPWAVQGLDGDMLPIDPDFLRASIRNAVKEVRHALATARLLDAHPGLNTAAEAMDTIGLFCELLSDDNAEAAFAAADGLADSSDPNQAVAAAHHALAICDKLAPRGRRSRRL